MDKKNETQKRHIPYASRLQIVTAGALCPVFLTVLALVNQYTSLPPVFSAIGFTLLYLLIVALMMLEGSQHIKSASVVGLQELLSEKGSLVFRNSTSPVIVVDSYGTVLWYNDALRDLVDQHGNFIGVPIEELLDNSITEDNFTKEPVLLFDRLYIIEGFNISNTGDGLHLAVLTDVTELSDTEKKYKDERTCVAYISIDNTDDVSQYIHEKFRDSIALVDNIIKEWAASLDGVIKSYDNDKYIMIFDSARLDECIANRFEILDKIRDV